MGRSPCCSKDGLNRGAWTALEDQFLIDYIKAHGEGQWRYLPKRAGLKRCGKSCRLRWFNYLRPDIKRGNISDDEDNLIIRLHNLLGNRWSLIAARLPGRTDNEIKNYWNTTLGKKIQAQSSSSPSKQRPKSTRAMTKKHATGPLIAEPAVPNLRTESQVIRTKSLRCTKFIFPSPHQPSISSPNNHLGGNSTKTKTKNSEELQALQSQYSSPRGSDNMMMDYGIGEFSVRRFLESNFLNYCLEDFQAMNGGADVYSNINYSLQFKEPILQEDWTETNFIEPNEAFGLGSFVHFS